MGVGLGVPVQSGRRGENCPGQARGAMGDAIAVIDAIIQEDVHSTVWKKRLIGCRRMDQLDGVA